MNKYFCTAPFSQLEIVPEGVCKICCKLFDQKVLDDNGNPYKIYETDLSTIWNSNWLNNFRQRFIEEEKRPECHLCWEEEEAGIVSIRQQMNRKVDIANPKLKDLTLKLSNKCNCACRICSWDLSSLWQSELEKTNRLDMSVQTWFEGNKIDKITDSNWEDLKTHLRDITQLQLYGGEPLINPEGLRVIEYLVNEGLSSRVSIVLNTNGTVTNERLFDMLDTFRFTELRFSIDDVGNRYEYERWPAKSESIFKELKVLHDAKDYKKLRLSFYTSISVFNVFDIGELLVKFQDYPKWKIMFDNLVNFPEILSITAIPEKVKPRVEAYLKSVDWKSNNWFRPNFNHRDSIIN